MSNLGISIKEELRYTELNDKRRNERFEKIVSAFCNSPTASVPTANLTWYDTKANYNFWRSEYFDDKDLHKSHQIQTKERARGKAVVLHIQDTTNVSFDSDAEDLGYLDKGRGRGVMMHNNLLVDGDGLILGLGDYSIWARAFAEMGKKKDRAKKPIEEKESYRWIDSVKNINNLLEGNEGIVIHIADRESDIYELLAMEQPSKRYLLLRGTHNRRTTNNELILDVLAKQKVALNIEFEAARGQNQDVELIKSELKFARLELAPPANKKELPAVTLDVILVKEINPPDGKKAITWLLLSTYPIENVEDALLGVKWYSYRWLVERFHYTLKSGCSLESLQLGSAKALRNAIITFSIVAFKLMRMLYISRKEPQASCEIIMEPSDWQILYQIHHRTYELPLHPPTAREVVRWLGQLGGFLARKSDGEPGIKTLWRGYRRFVEMKYIWEIQEKGSFQQ